MEIKLSRTGVPDRLERVKNSKWIWS